MRQFRTLWLHFFDVRPGERLRTLFMFLYLLFVLFAYYILKPVSRAMFLNKFDIDQLPYLIILIAAGGGMLAYLYSKVAVKASLRVAVFWATALSLGSLVAIWWLLSFQFAWMLYVLNIWVSLFSIMTVSQGWLVAGNIFNNREAKRIYPLLTLAMVIGAAFGGEFTNRTVRLVGARNLLLASAVLVLLAYFSYLAAVAQKGVSLAGARGGEGEAEFGFADIVRDIARTRHLQVIIGIMFMIFVVDTIIDFQFQAMAKAAYQGAQLTAFFGRFWGLYLNGTEFVLQFFLTALIVGRFGVGGTLQALPTAVVLASLGTVAIPGVVTASIARLAEASTRYTLNRTGLELLYMPLPTELRNRIKAFIDIFFDRVSRGVAGVLLVVLTGVLDVKVRPAASVRELALVVIGICIPWVLLSLRARHEYVATIRRRLASRRLDLENARVSVGDRETIALLEEAAAQGSARQAAYALSLLGEAPNYNLKPLLERLAESPLPEVRAEVYVLARAQGFNGLLESALKDLAFASGEVSVKPAVAYIISVSPDRLRIAREFLDSENPLIAEGAIDALAEQPSLCAELMTHGWIARNAADPSAFRRVLAARAVGACGDQGTEALFRLLSDPDPQVIAAACRAAGATRNRAYVYGIVTHLSNARVRQAAIEALARYGAPICGTLSDLLLDPEQPVALRRQIPRVLKLIPHQRSADVLLAAVGHQDLSIRASVLKALNGLRLSAPDLNFETGFVTAQILAEARYYFELSAALAPFRGPEPKPRTAARLLVETLQERLAQTLERLFRLLGLRYPPKEIYSAYLAVARRQSEEASSALEFLDNVLERDLKRILLPLLDAPDRVLARGRDLFGVEVPDAESAIRELLHSRDPWLLACAIAAAGELQFKSLAGEIANLAESVTEVSAVANSTRLALA